MTRGLQVMAAFAWTASVWAGPSQSQDVGLAARIAAAIDAGGTEQGHIFAPDVTLRIRAIIRKAFDGPGGRNIRRTIRETEPLPPITMRVREVYPDDVKFTTMPPTLLRVLPALPADLTYRIVGRTLVLLDPRTNVILDFIPNAIPRE